MIDRIQSYDSEAFSRFAAQDKDGDGLTAGEELARLSSDGKIDTDGDGVLDPSDLSPNLRSAGTLRGRLEGKLLDNIISDWAHTFDPTLLLYITYVSCDTPVIRDPAVTTIMANKHDYPLLVALFNPRQYIELTDLFNIPGFAYGYHVLINCGDRCRHTEYVVLLDFPLFGLNRLFRIPVDQNIWAVYAI